MKFFSMTERGFYDSEIHGDAMPKDAKEITDAAYLALMAGQSDEAKGIEWSGAKPTLKALPKPVAAVPARVTMRQARLALLNAGKLSGIAPALAAMPAGQREAAEIEWEFATNVERESKIVAMLAAALHLDAAALDQLFTAAAAL
jgi:hypothetical protein